MTAGNVTQNTNRQQTAINQMVGQFRDKTNILALLASFTAETQLLENVFFDLLLLRCISAGQGVQLDTIGSRIGQVRLGWTDDVYRLWLYARVLINHSSGTVPQIYVIFETVIGSFVGYIEKTPPAAFVFWMTTPVSQPAIMGAMLQEITGAGIGSQLVNASTVDTFTLSDSSNGGPPSSTTLGFSDSSSPGTGGVLPGTY